MSSPLSEAVAAAAGVIGRRARFDVPLGSFTTYRVGGPAALFVADAAMSDLHLVREAMAASGLPCLVVGRGSNLLVADAGFPGIGLTLGEEFATIDSPASADGASADGSSGSDEGRPHRVRAGGAVSLPVLARRTAALGLRGFEWAVGVPGSVGGAVRMNAGGHGSDIRASLVRASIFDLAGAGGSGPHELDAAELDLGYRSSAVQPGQVVLAAEFALTPGDRPAAEAVIADVVRWRRDHQPGGANAGSVFANPEGDSAGRLIDAAGLRGRRRGSASVSTRHANFVQVDSGGSADDVRALMAEIRAAVLDRFGVALVVENRLVGFEAQNDDTV